MIKRLFVLLAALSLFGCTQTAASNSAVSAESGSTPSDASSQPDAEKETLYISVGEHEFRATLEENVSAQEFRKLLEKGAVTVSMDDYGGFEKVGPLGTTLTRSDEAITTQPGDVILYQGSQIVIYYAPNSWNFTKLAKIEDASDLKEKLGEGSIEATFSLEQQK